MDEPKRTALIYDFDGTLARGNLQETSFIPNIGMTKEDFWAEVKARTRDHDADEILVYMHLMLDKAGEKGVQVTVEDLRRHGEAAPLFPGLADKSWFDRINAHAAERGLVLEHYIVSSGIHEMIEGCAIRDAFRQVFASKFIYVEGVAAWPGVSELLEETIRAYREKRLSEREYLNSVVDLATKVARKDRGRDVPKSIRGDEDAQAFFGILDGQLKTNGDEPVANDDSAAIAQQIIDIIKSHLIVDIWSNEVAQNNLRNAIDDYFFDVLRDEKGIDLPVEVLDDLELKIMDLARARFAA